MATVNHKEARREREMRVHNAYCYNSKCSPRTKEKPWPRSDGEYKRVTVTSKKGTQYKRKLFVCQHCGERMQFVASAYE
jgi:hypothetical protein